MISRTIRTAMSLGGGLCFALLAACQMATSTQAVAKDGGQRMYGVNIAGGEFQAETLPGQYARNYIYPEASVSSPFLKQGFDTVRMPVLWERIQPRAMKPLLGPEMALIDKSIASMSGFGTIIIDIHNYGYYRRAKLDDETGGAMLADLWTRLAEKYKDNPRVAFGIMNEPFDIDARAWRKMVDTSVAAIRATGAKNLILIPGTRYSGAHSWMSGGDASNAAAFAGFKDPGNNFLFELHQYLDTDSSGTNMQCAGAKVGSERLVEVTTWLRAQKARGLLGEFGASPDPVCMEALEDLMAYMDSNSDVWRGWTYWAAGAWWGDAYPFNLQPDGDKQKPQMAVLKRHMKR